MTEGGFFERRRTSPTGLVLVIAMHSAALGALALMKGPEIQRRIFGPTTVYQIPEPQDPPPAAQPEPQRDRPVAISQPRRIIDVPLSPPPIDARPADPPLPPLRQADPAPATPIREQPPAAPVRIAARIDPRHAGALQPPYPGSEQRAQRGGTVRVRVTIGADGRVQAVERLSATSDAFWEATRRQALERWRFRPATEDGRPVESVKEMTVIFRIEDA